MTMEKKVMTEKRSSDFGQEKCTPKENPGYAYDIQRIIAMSIFSQ